MTPTARDLLIGTPTPHGGNRRPSRRDPVFKPDPVELAAWTAANRRARYAYYAKPNAVTLAVYGR